MLFHSRRRVSSIGKGRTLGNERPAWSSVYFLATLLQLHPWQRASLNGKRVTPHVLRHTAAMELLQAGVDRSVIALWLGHESVDTTQIYLDANLALKEQALAKASPGTEQSVTRYRPDDQLTAFLKGL